MFFRFAAIASSRAASAALALPRAASGIFGRARGRSCSRANGRRSRGVFLANRSNRDASALPSDEVDRFHVSNREPNTRPSTLSCGRESPRCSPSAREVPGDIRYRETVRLCAVWPELIFCDVGDYIDQNGLRIQPVTAVGPGSVISVQVMCTEILNAARSD